MTVTLSVEDYDRARRDPVEFARLLIGQPLWPHQVEVVRSTARYRVICAGRRAGKTRVFGTLALHQGVAVAGSQVLIVSATDRSSKRMLADIAGMARAASLLRSSVDDESTSRLVLTNGSVIECVPASMGAVRSAEADLLIVDEAGFVDQSIWEAVEPVVVARPGSRVLICSSPWGDVNHFFRRLWQGGMDHPDEQVRSWHWPSTVSPMVDAELLEEIRERSSAEYFLREYEAVWSDAAGSFFASADIEAAVDASTPMLEPEDAAGRGAVGGVDWGQARDASTLVVIVADGPATLARDDGRTVYRVVLAREWFARPYHEVIDALVVAARGFDFVALVGETNGVGAMPVAELQRACVTAGLGDPVVPVNTTTTTKADGFGLVRMLLQQRRLLLPDHPPLLRQLRALRFEQLQSGAVRISVPDAVGHDDLAVGLYLAAWALIDAELLPVDDRIYTIEDVLPDWQPVSAGPDV